MTMKNILNIKKIRRFLEPFWPAIILIKTESEKSFTLDCKICTNLFKAEEVLTVLTGSNWFHCSITAACFLAIVVDMKRAWEGWRKSSQDKKKVISSICQPFPVGLKQHLTSPPVEPLPVLDTETFDKRVPLSENQFETPSGQLGLSCDCAKTVSFSKITHLLFSKNIWREESAKRRWSSKSPFASRIKLLAESVLRLILPTGQSFAEKMSFKLSFGD